MAEDKTNRNKRRKEWLIIEFVPERSFIKKRPKPKPPRKSTFTVVFTDAQRQRSWIIIIDIILCEFHAVNQS